MSFTLDIKQILQYSVNIFSSFMPMVYVYAGASFALFIIFAVIAKVKGSK